MNAPADQPASVPVDMAIACCTPLALAALRMWLDAGARPKTAANLMVVGGRVLAVIDFEEAVERRGVACNGLTMPLIVTLWEREPNTGMLERVKAGDRLVKQLRTRLRGATA